MVISAAFAGAVSVPAAASHRCGYDDAALVAGTGLYTGFVGAGLAYSQVDCDLFHGNPESIEDADADQEELDIYLLVESEESSRSQLFQVQSNYINDSNTIAWSVVQNTTYTYYQEGRSEAVTATRARSAVQDYYSGRQLQTLRAWNDTANRMEYWEDVTQNESDISDNYLEVVDSGDCDGLQVNRTVTRNVTLANDSQVQVQAVEMVADYDGTVHVWSPAGYEETGCPPERLRAKKPSDNFDEPATLEFSDYRQSFLQPKRAARGLASEVDTFVNSTYVSIEDGNATPQDLLDYKTIVQEMATANTSDQGGALLNALSLGLTPANLNRTGGVTLDMANGGTREGIIITGNKSRDAFRKGETINGANDSDRYYLATSEGLVPIQEQATIQNITNRSGAEIDEVDTSTTSRTVTDASNLDPLVEKLSKEREEAEERKQAAGGCLFCSGSGGGLSGLEILGFTGVSALLVILIAATIVAAYLDIISPGS